MKKVAVTGANGFIGGYLIDALLRNGYEVLCLGRTAESLADINGSIERHVTDYSVEDLTRAMSGCHVLVHLAGRRSIRGEDMELVSEFAHVGTKMLDGLLRASLNNKLEKVIQASSIAVYSAANNKPYNELETPVPASNYGLAKYFCEQYADWWSKRHNIPVAHLRIAACFGAGEKLTPALMSIASKAAQKDHVTVSNGGVHTIDQIYVEDVASAILLVMESDASGPLNIGSGKAVTVREIAETANDVFENYNNLTISAQADDAVLDSRNYVNIDRAFVLMGWKPKFDLRQGLQAMRDKWNNSLNKGNVDNANS